MPRSVAVAETGTLTTEFAASLVTARLPLELPAACGVNVTAKALRWPAARVRGKVIPLILKPRPLTVTLRTVTFMLPELIRVADRVWLAPILTLPKARLAGETTSWPEPIPVPETGTLRAVGQVVNATTVSLPRPPNGVGRRFGRFIEIVPIKEMVPVTAPFEAGVKFTETGALCPPCSVMGRVSPLRANSVPETAMRAMVTAILPGLVNVAAWVWVLPV